MNLRALNIKWALALAAAAAIGAIGVVLVLTLMGGDEEETSVKSAAPTVTPSATRLATVTPAPTATAEATEPPAPTEMAAVTPGCPEPPLRDDLAVIPAVPPGFNAGDMRPCPEGWSRMIDDVAKYTMCIPPGWGQPGPASGEPAVPPVVHYLAPFFLSPEAFPYPIGTPGAVPAEPDWLRISLTVLTSQSLVINMCEPELGVTIDSLPAATCEYKYDVIRCGTIPPWEQPNPAGRWSGLNVYVPLPNSGPVPPDLEGVPLPRPTGSYSTGLYIRATALNEVMDRHRDLVWQILSTVQIIP